jgi:BirA family biotin operon repressor/biotin-[acetyl-CoA-carboxylase] ligase
MSDRPLTLSFVVAALGSLSTRFDVDILDECDSTNARLLARAEAGAASGTAIVARRQTAGRGRLGRHWHSATGDSLTFSLLWRVPAGRPVEGLSLAVGVAVAEALESAGRRDIALKWPNDILLDGGKLGGILIELCGNAAVIGIGINLRLPADLPADIRDTAAALDSTDDVNGLLAGILTSLHDVLLAFAAGGFAALHERWQRRNAHAGRDVRILSAQGPVLAGRCLGVAPDGALLVETSAGVERVISGEVSLRVP